MMDDDILPVTSHVMDGEEVIDVIYGNERRNVLQEDVIIIAIKTDPDTNKKTITRRYKITKVDTEKSDAGIDELKVSCVIMD